MTERRTVQQIELLTIECGQSLKKFEKEVNDFLKDHEIIKVHAFTDADGWNVCIVYWKAVDSSPPVDI